jgi:very-short-patch-repair endonuclease
MFTINDKSNYFQDVLSESAIERLFMEEVVKYLENGTKIGQQFEYLTKIGKFRVDFIIRKDDTEYVVELDGKEFHDEQYDLWRDSFLLGEKKIKSIVRIKGKDITYSLNESLYFLSKTFPNTFSKRGKLNLSTLIEPKNKETIDKNIENNMFDCIDKFYLEKVELEHDEIKKYPSIEIKIKDLIKFTTWKKYYGFALKNNTYDIESLNKKYFEN